MHILYNGVVPKAKKTSGSMGYRIIVTPNLHNFQQIPTRISDKEPVLVKISAFRIGGFGFHNLNASRFEFRTGLSQILNLKCQMVPYCSSTFHRR